MQERGQKGSLQLGPMPSKALVLRLLSEGLEEPGHPPTLPSGKLCRLVQKGLHAEAGSWRPLYLGPREGGGHWGVKEFLEEGSGQP